MKISRWQWIAGIAIAVMILLTIIVPPSRTQITEGSTYSRSPSGYAAWYAYMQQTKPKVKIQRWQKSFLALEAIDTSITLIRINPQLDPVTQREQKWLDRGNNLILIGVSAKTTDAPFSKLISSKSGKIKIETTRRKGSNLLTPKDEKLALKLDLNSLVLSGTVTSDSTESSEDIKLLGDEFGSIVWGSGGNLISSATPYLAANAYQNEQGNYKFLANLVTAFKTPVYIDEYIHGYRDAEEITTAEQDWISYLLSTPLFAGIAQALVVLIVLIVAKNRRLGAAIAPSSPSVNNSQAYIQAMSTVLQKAETHEFVWQAIAKAEQKKLQQKLGVKDADRQTLITAWQQTGRPESELEYLLNPMKPKAKISDRQLLNWLLHWQRVLKSLS